MTSVPVLVLGILALVVAGLLLPILIWLAWRARGAAAEVRTRLGEGRIRAFDASANFLGRETWGVSQIRGSGCLGLSDEEILFLMWVPRREIRIPRVQVREVETAMSFLTATNFRPLLVVHFLDEAGHADAAAWRVRDIEKWIRALDS